MEPSGPFLPLEALPLLDAVLCADCEIISNSRGDHCEVCGSRSLLSLARILGGSAGPIRAVVSNLTPNELRNTFTVLVNPEASHTLRARRRRKQNAHLEDRLPLESTGE
jgi:hypothetical protein